MRLLLAFLFLGLGVYQPYPGESREQTKPPIGYRPFYLSHYGRHGSRYLSSEKMIRPALDALCRADAEGQLTTHGKQLLSMVSEVDSVSRGMWGELSPLGVEEHRGIARRMVSRYPEVFQDSVHAVASLYPRCIVSMAASTGEIRSRKPRVHLSYTCGKRYQRVVNSLQKPSGDRPSGASLQRQYLQQHLDMDGLLLRIFRQRETVSSPAAFFKALYLAWIAREAIQLPYFDLQGILGEEAIRTLTESNHLALYQNMGFPCSDTLLADVIARADLAIHSGKSSADLRYGHDSGLMKFLVRAGVEGYPAGLSEEEAVQYDFGAHVPMGANLQMVFYRKRRGPVLVKFLVNEQETRLKGLPGGPYYDWNDVKQYWNRP